jgi:VanZ like family/Concanavalin A-like lectin/glucanases superfamily
MTRKILGAICLCTLCGILVAGLWPFHAPSNEVSWVNQGSGLRFGKHGSVVSAGRFTAKPSESSSPCSIELWLEPSRTHSSGTILAFYNPETQVVAFAMRQSLGDLVLQSAPPSPRHYGGKDKIYIDDVLGRRQPVLVTITSGQSGTMVYADGGLVKQASTFSFTSRDLTGQLVLGNSPVTAHTWSGQLLGLTIYRRELSPSEIAEHYADLTRTKQTSLAERRGVVALYLFNEGSGKLVRNQADPETDLLIPDRFFLVHARFLERPWDEFRNDWNYWKDVGINVGGFIPLGFFFFAFFCSPAGNKRAAVATIAFGFAVSLTIEILQAFLPTRDSGMTDLITNTFGTALGVSLFVWMRKHNRIAQAEMRIAAGEDRAEHLPMIEGSGD